MSQYADATEPPLSSTQHDHGSATVAIMLVTVEPKPVQSLVAYVVIDHDVAVSCSARARSGCAPMIANANIALPRPRRPTRLPRGGGRLPRGGGCCTRTVIWSALPALRGSHADLPRNPLALINPNMLHSSYN